MVVITGAAGDIGAAMAHRLSDEGAAVGLVDIDPPEKLAEELPKAMALAVDVRDESACRKAVRDIVLEFGRPTGLINNAAVVTPSASVVDIAIEDWRHAIDVNLTGAMLMSRAVIPEMTALGRGVIIHVASQLGQVAAEGRAVYGATKAALIHLAKTMALDHAAQGIRVASLSPGPILTSRLTSRYGDAAAVNHALQAKCPIGRVGFPADVAAAAAFLLSSDADFLTGSDLLLDGGYCLP